jgi:hypothetical protein
MELAVHGWDIRSQLEPAAPLSAETLPVVSDWAGRRGGNFLGLTDFRPRSSLLAPVCYHFALTDIPTSGYDIVVENDSIRMGPAVPASPNVTLRGDARIGSLKHFLRRRSGAHPWSLLAPLAGSRARRGSPAGALRRKVSSGAARPRQASPHGGG